MCSLHDTLVDEACKWIVARGQGAILAKFDVEGAFCTVPVHPDDRQLLGMRWEGQLYVDKVLPFGFRSAPKLYKAVVDALLWILERSDGVNGLHYLDDFLLFGEPNSSQCERALQAALARCRNLGVPVAPGKTKSPSTTLTFFGIELDTESLTMRPSQIGASSAGDPAMGGSQVLFQEGVIIHHRAVAACMLCD